MLAEDAAHFHSCKQIRRSAVTARHDHIVKTLARLFRRTGAFVREEPRIFDVKRQRPDLEITMVDRPDADRLLLLDVEVTHACSPSYHSPDHLAAATKAEKRKVADYKEFAARQGAAFSPFVLETYGSFGKAATEVLKILQTQAASSATLTIPLDEFAAHCVRTLSVALQKGNGMVAKRGMDRARVPARLAGRKRRQPDPEDSEEQGGDEEEE